MTGQLNLLGTVDDPIDLELGIVQREVVRELRRLRTLSKDEAGAIAHEHRGKHSREQRCEFCGADGAAILGALLRRGVAIKAPEGDVAPARLDLAS